MTATFIVIGGIAAFAVLGWMWWKFDRFCNDYDDWNDYT